MTCELLSSLNSEECHSSRLGTFKLSLQQFPSTYEGNTRNRGRGESGVERVDPATPAIHLLLHSGWFSPITTRYGFKMRIYILKTQLGIMMVYGIGKISGYLSLM